MNLEEPITLNGPVTLDRFIRSVNEVYRKIIKERDLELLRIWVIYLMEMT